ncbi:MAG: Spo0E family sporulation regulatory protein-aspartic acid phosphatase [Vulcanibacillus sp.]
MEEERLKVEIERLRKMMEHEAERLGLNHQKVLKISQRIDRLHTKLIIVQSTYVQKKKIDDFLRENYILQVS